MNPIVKGAVATAMDHVKALGDLLPANRPRLEETVLKGDGHWLITFSDNNPDTFDERAYKIFEIDPEQREALANGRVLPEHYRDGR